MSKRIVPINATRRVSSWLIIDENPDTTREELVADIYERAPTRRSRAYDNLSGSKGRTQKGGSKIGKRDIRVILKLLEKIEMEPFVERLYKKERK